MMENIHFYEPAKGHGLRHNPFNALVAPRPIGWISSQSVEGHLNLAPYSFFNAFNYHPPIVGFSSVGFKDTLRNIQETGEFGWNLATRSLAEAVNISSEATAPEINEFELAGVTPVKSKLISVPRVKESPVSFECRLTQVVQLKGVDNCLVDTWMVFGEVVGVHIYQDLIVDGVYDTASSQTIMRGGGPADYFEIGAEQLFRIYRPK
ncbi:flavin reductase family protein [Stutzerimonas stutzeri]|uniref:Flavin reductase family protein n=1 Tax=Stutzerimonas stutzeri TaxID=316 RepID=A0A6I6LPN9_STUST|nr:flavin reductase family protein [Stutzerimonas stutzeri]QGZ31130.1 flavin reductase family protein [Stutzerimonas stutzeri]